MALKYTAEKRQDSGKTYIQKRRCILYAIIKNYKVSNSSSAYFFTAQRNIISCAPKKFYNVSNSSSANFLMASKFSTIIFAFAFPKLNGYLSSSDLLRIISLFPLYSPYSIIFASG